jgi:hypothetical protein
MSIVPLNDLFPSRQEPRSENGPLVVMLALVNATNASFLDGYTHAA